RKGMILGCGAVGLVVESSAAAFFRGVSPSAPSVEIVGSVFLNSAFHASLMDKQTTAAGLKKFIAKMCENLHIDEGTLAKDCLYF
ncbi:hypothetical protein ACXYUI_30250, partial [Klebsiella pneumoniae]